MEREVVLRPAPTLRPLTWAGVEAACAALARTGDGPPERAALDLSALLSTPPERVVVTADVAFVRAACADDDPGAARALETLPTGVVADLVLAAFREACAEANAEARAYGARRLAAMPAAYARGFTRWSEPGGPEEGETPSARSLAVDLAGRGPEAWAVLEDWPLARTLRYLEDCAVGAFLRELDEMTAPPAAARAGRGPGRGRG